MVDDRKPIQFQFRDGKHILDVIGLVELSEVLSGGLGCPAVIIKNAGHIIGCQDTRKGSPALCTGDPPIVKASVHCWEYTLQKLLDKKDDNYGLFDSSDFNYKKIISEPKEKL